MYTALWLRRKIAKNKRMLVEKDFVEKQGNAFRFVDPLFAIWFKRRYNIK